MRSSSSGFLLLLLGALALIGFLTGNLDRWLAYLFSAGTSTIPVADVKPTSSPAPAAGADRRSPASPVVLI